jgi:fructose 1,6-bisphosphate aldolase/phosphatase
MKMTVSVIKADIGSLGGHAMPHPAMMDACRKGLAEGTKAGTILDYYVTRCGDDIQLLILHDRGEGSEKVHKLAWDTFVAGTRVAKELKVYAAGQDLLSDAFSGNVKGLGPGAAEITFEPRKSEPIIFLFADKTEPSAYSLPLCRIFMDPFTTTGLVIDPRMKEGFDFEVQDVMDSLRVNLVTPEEAYDLLCLLGDTTRYAIKRIKSRDKELGEAAVVSTDKLNVSAGKYVGKDDPVCVLRSQAGLPATGEIMQPFMTPMLVAGWNRGSHYGAWYPCAVEDSAPVFFDGPPRLCAISMQVSDQRFQGAEPKDSKPGEHLPVDMFAGSVWDGIRRQSVELSVSMRKHGPFMPAIVPPEELEYTTRPTVLKKLASRMTKMEK